MDVDYLKQFGYTEIELEQYLNSWNNNIILVLSDNKDTVLKNMQLIKNEFDKDLLIKFPVFYVDTFCLTHSIFKKRITIFKNTFSNWKEIVIEQFYGCDEMSEAEYPVLKAMGSYDIKIFYDSMNFLLPDNDKKYEFMVLLEKEAGIDINRNDFICDDLYSYEVNKHEIVKNAIMLVNEGFPKDIVKDMIANNIDIFCYSKDGLKAALIKAYGTDYRKRIKEESDSGRLADTIIRI